MTWADSFGETGSGLIRHIVLNLRGCVIAGMHRGKISLTL